MTDYSASLKRLVDAQMQAMIREAEAKMRHETEWRAEYEPIIRKTAVGAGAWTVAQVAEFLLTDDGVHNALVEAFRERHPNDAAFASDLADTAQSVLSSCVADINVVAVDDRK